MQCWRSQGTAGCLGGQQCCQRQRLGPAKRQAAVWLPAPCRARGFLPLAAAPGSSVLWGNVGPPWDGEAQCGRASLSTAQRKGRRPAARPGMDVPLSHSGHGKPPNATKVPAAGDAGEEPGGTDATALGKQTGELWSPSRRSQPLACFPSCFRGPG